MSVTVVKNPLNPSDRLKSSTIPPSIDSTTVYNRKIHSNRTTPKQTGRPRTSQGGAATRESCDVSRSKYLWYLERHGPVNIQKMVLHNATIRSIVARCISGILLGIPWESSQIKNESDKYQDLCTGRWFLREIKWLLKRVCVSYCFRFPFLFPVPLKQRQLDQGLIILQGEKNSRRPNAHSGFRQSDASTILHNQQPNDLLRRLRIRRPTPLQRS